MIEIQPQLGLEHKFGDFKKFLLEIIENDELLQELRKFIYPPSGQEPYNIENNRDFCSILIEFYFRYEDKDKDKYTNEDILRLVNIHIYKWYDVLKLEQRNEVDKLLNQIRERLNQLEHH
jgi:hypothetical protein